MLIAYILTDTDPVSQTPEPEHGVMLYVLRHTDWCFVLRYYFNPNRDRCLKEQKASHIPTGSVS